MGDYFHVRAVDPSSCEMGSFRTKDIGNPGGMKAKFCRSGDKFVIQSFLIPKENAFVCDNTLCGKNDRGWKEIRSIEKSGSKRIVPLVEKGADDWQLVEGF